VKTYTLECLNGVSRELSLYSQQSDPQAEISQGKEAVRKTVDTVITLGRFEGMDGGGLHGVVQCELEGRWISKI
jgi:hypothetical protein